VSVEDDPGWLPAFRPWWHLVVPWMPFRFLKPERERLDLIGLRHVFVHTAIALVELCVLTQLVVDGQGRTIPPLVWIVGVLAISWAVGGIAWTLGRRLATGTDEALAARFRAASMITLGLAASPALWGIAGSYLVGRPEPSWVGAFVSVLLLAWVAPRRSRLDRVDEELRASGSILSIRRAIDP
jgi:hypothetical protein